MVTSDEPSKKAVAEGAALYCMPFFPTLAARATPDLTNDFFLLQTYASLSLHGQLDSPSVAQSRNHHLFSHLTCATWDHAKRSLMSTDVKCRRVDFVPYFQREKLYKQTKSSANLSIVQSAVTKVIACHFRKFISVLLVGAISCG